MNKFICIEGIDATGKTSVSQGLAKRLGGVYYKTPGKVSPEERARIDKIDISVKERFDFFMAAIAQDSKEIEKILLRSPVVADRYIYSTIASHKAMDDSIDLNGCVDGLIMPDKTILLQSDALKIRTRLMQRDLITRFEENEELMEKTNAEFLKQQHIVFDTTHTTVDEAVERILTIIG